VLIFLQFHWRTDVTSDWVTFVTVETGEEPDIVVDGDINPCCEDIGAGEPIDQIRRQMYKQEQITLKASQEALSIT
jgi:hypothetical protein